MVAKPQKLLVATRIAAFVRRIDSNGAFADKAAVDVETAVNLAQPLSSARFFAGRNIKRIAVPPAPSVRLGADTLRSRP